MCFKKYLPEWKLLPVQTCTWREILGRPWRLLQSLSVKERVENKKVTSDSRKDFLDALLEFRGSGKDAPHKLSERHLNIFILPIDIICLGAFYDVAVPLAYYAHLAAFRARFYMEPETSDSESIASGMAGGRGGAGADPRPTRGPGANAAVRPLPALKENVKRVMFYC
ncbi:hypothetical protein POTOM_050161 [Populus tomentosa]|uniref:Uncharacterized protein n=1 Tax=Populus tomentosa TaxID=118781 RepID=A0A8X7YI13_POPTO|nr:hypothetical protein POTOM_050161 [Populus tomentosa]